MQERLQSLDTVLCGCYERIKMKRRSTKPSRNLNQSSDDLLIDFVIITALEVERKAVCRAFKLLDKHRVKRDSRVYWRGRLQLNDGEFYEIAVAQAADMANVNSALLTSDSIHHWKPEGLLLVGIAGAVSDEIGLGDVVVGTEVFYYERGKQTPFGRRREPKQYPADNTLINNAIAVRRWRASVPVARPDGNQIRPAIHYGVIASGEMVIADEHTRDELIEQHRKILAIEMEGYGLSVAAWQSFDRIRHLVIRAICDRADSKKTAKWHDYAAAAAAGFARHFLRDRPLDPRNPTAHPDEDREPPVLEELQRQHKELQHGQQETREDFRKVQKLLAHVSTEISLISSKSELDAPESVVKSSLPGSAGTGGEKTFGLELSDVGSQIEGLLSSLSIAISKERSNEIETIRELNREGKAQEAYELLVRMQHDPTWQYIEKPVRARALRVMAAIAVNARNDFEAARQLAHDAAEIDPSGDDTTIRTLLRLHSDGPHAALGEIGEISDPDKLNLKTSLLINVQKIDKAVALITHPPDGVRPDIETKRLHALACLYKGNLNEAAALISEVIVERPRWEFARYVAAMTDYARALSPAAFPKPFSQWPQPVEWALVKTDEESQRLLSNAEFQFAQLAAETQSNEETRKVLQSWRLASLANDATRQKEAAEYCEHLLKQDPTDHRALAWAMLRNFVVDFDESQRSLEDNLSNDLPLSIVKLEKILTLIGIYLRSKKTLEAIRCLEDSRAEFVEVGAESLWVYWLAKVYVVHGEPDKAIKLAKEIDNGSRRSIEAMVLRESAIRKNDWQPVVTFLERSFEETSDGVFILELCQLKFHQKEWAYVADKADDLIKAITTQDSVRLCVSAAWNAQQPERCLEILWKYQALFSRNVLPSDLKRLQIQCQAISGKLQAALSNAEQLVREESSTENIIVLIDVQRQTGDLKGLTITARSLLQREDVTPTSLIRAARIVHVEQPELAKEFWHRAKPGVVEDANLLGEAVMIGYALGLDDEVAPLFQKAQLLTAQGKGVFRAFDLKEFGDWLRGRSEYVNNIQRTYGKGEIPLQLFAHAMRLPLVDLLHGLPQQSREATDLRFQPHLFVRHGGRPILKEFARTSRDSRLHLDITAILVAEHLGILEMVEHQFKPLRIPPTLPMALTAQRELLMPQQPSQLPTYRLILKLVESTGLHLIAEEPTVSEEVDELIAQMGKRWISVLRRAQSENGFLVDYLPLKSNDQERTEVKLPPGLADHVISCRSLLESLKSNVGLSDQTYEEMSKALRNQGSDSDQGAVPPLGAKVFLTGNIAGALAGAKMLELVCEKFEAYVDSLYLQEARNTSIEVDRRAESQVWLSRLADRVSRGLADGTYITLALTDEELNSIADQEEDHNPDFRSTSELLAVKTEKGDVLWIDDRLLNSHSGRDGVVPIIGVNEILVALKELRALSEQEYYDKLLNLRAGNFRYIPMDETEILYHLNQAPVSPQGILLETPELSTLRRYLNATFLDAPFLQKPPLPEWAPNKFGEVAFVSEPVQAITDAMVSVWADENTPVESAWARAEWLLVNLFTGLFGVLHVLPNRENRGDGIRELGMDVAAVFAKALTIKGNVLKKDQPNRRKIFFDWLEMRLAAARFRADPATVKIAAKLLESMLDNTTVRREYDSPELEKYDRIYKNLYYSDLPEALKSEINSNPKLMESLGITMVEVATVGPFHCSASEYWNRVAETMNSGNAKVRSVEVDVELSLVRSRDDEGTSIIEVLNENNEVIHRFKDPILDVLLTNKTRQERVLRKHRFWFQCNERVFEKEIKQIVRIKDARARIERVQNWRTRSAEYYYRNLQERLAETKRLVWEELIPAKSESLLDHFRLRLKTQVASGKRIAFQKQIDRASDKLLADEGIEASLTRLTCLPMELPERVALKFVRLRTVEKKRLLKIFSNTWNSPVSKLHLISLCLRCGHKDVEIREIANSALRELFDETAGAMLFDEFELLLDYVNCEFGYRLDILQWDQQTRLAMVWAHASRLQNLFHSAGILSDEIVRLIQSHSQPMPTDILSRDPHYWNDILHPHRLSRIVFLTHGVGKMFARYDKKLLTELGLPRLMDCVGFKDERDAADSLMELVRDPLLTYNGTASFLGGDRAEALSANLELKNSEVLSSERLQEETARAVESAQLDPVQGPWTTLVAITRDAPIYERSRDALRTLLQTLDFDSILANDPVNANLVLQVAAYQIPYLGDEQLRLRYEDALITAVRFYAQKQVDTCPKQKGPSDGLAQVPFNNIVSELLEVALSLSIRIEDPRKTAEAWGNLLIRMLDSWSLVRDRIASTVVNLVFELPAIQLPGLWQVALAVRASSKKFP
jgi:nucleoside phosphorylase